MGQFGLWRRFKWGVSGLAFKVFLWGYGLAEDDYYQQIYQQEKEYMELQI